MQNHAQLMQAMIDYEQGIPKQVQHFLKVHNFARTIGQLEQIDEQTLFVLEAASIVHDIGIRQSMEKYGNSNGKNQEELGPPIAETMLQKLGYEKNVIDRVCYLVGHHHTYNKIDGIDYQILVEADFLVNIYEGEYAAEASKSVYEKIFKTKTGKHFFEMMYGMVACTE